MKGIRFLSDVKEPERIKVDNSRHVKEFMSKEDEIKRKKHWDERTKGNPNFFDGGLGNLMDSRGDRKYIASNFSIYETLALSAFGGKNPYSNGLTNVLRSSAVTCSLETRDHYVIVQKIPEGIVGGGLIDPTCGGMVPVNEESYINPKERMLSRLEREPHIKRENIVYLKYTGAHLAMDILTLTDTYAGKINKSMEEVLKDFKEDGSASITGIPIGELKSYILDHSVGNIEPKMVDDATATLLASLNTGDFNKTIKKMRKIGGIIEFGKYIDGEFIREENYFPVI